MRIQNKNEMTNLFSSLFYNPIYYSEPEMFVIITFDFFLFSSFFFFLLKKKKKNVNLREKDKIKNQLKKEKNKAEKQFMSLTINC